MRLLACCLLACVTGCASAENGGGEPFLTGDLSLRRDLARPADLVAGPGADLTGMPRIDMAQLVDLSSPPPDLAVIPQGDLAAAPNDLRALPDVAMAPPDLATRPDLVAPRDLAAPPDLAVPPDFAVPPDLATAPDMALPACRILVNEIMTGDGFSGADEFVEFYNPCLNAVDLVGYAMVYRTGTNANGPAAAGDDATINFGMTPNIFVVPGRGYLTACTRTYSLLTGLCDASYMNATLQDKVGAVGLRDGNGNLVDSVAYGAVVQGHAFTKVAPAPQPPVTFIGDSIGRLPNGVDTGNNSKDWKATALTTVDAPNR